MVEVKLTVSAVMAEYNSEVYIGQAIDSIISQLDSNDELIILDDGSTDGTKNIVLEYQTKYKNIRFYTNQKNYGVDYTMNRLFDLSAKDLIVVCDSDDISLPNRIEVVRKFFEENKDSDFLYHNAFVIDAKNNIISNSFFKIFHQKYNLIYNILYSTYYGTCFCFRRSFYLQNKIKFVRLIKLYPWDRVLGFMSRKKHSLKFLDSNLLKYRRYQNNISRKKKESIFKKIKKRIGHIKLYLQC